LIAANCLPSNTTYNGVVDRWSKKIGQPDVWEFMRGVIWNDDPACALFKDDADNNGNFGIGLDFLKSFKSMSLWKRFTDVIITWWHHDDLQFLHAMGCSPGELPQESKRKVILWLEVMYKLAVGQVRPNDRIDSTPLRDFFNSGTVPQGSDTLRNLLLGKTKSYKYIIIERRALGSCSIPFRTRTPWGTASDGLRIPRTKIM
jgi:hypothetical protein